jgi:hypothetical protein
MDMNERQRRAAIRQAKRRRQVFIGRLILGILAVLLVALCVFLVRDFVGGKKEKPSSNTQMTEEITPVPEKENQPAEKQTESDAAKETEVQTETGTLEKAEHMAAQYDYDGAIALLKESPEYETNTAMQEAVIKFETEKAACVEYPIDQVTHVFYHSMIVDTARAFGKGAGDATTDGLNQVMTTMSEFEQITKTMYERGYVMVSPHDMCQIDENGNVTPGKILLPEGKKPFVLSQDDVSYYHYQDGYGLADKLLIDENGKVKNQYTDADGNVLIGDYDMVPWIDTFVEEHPDFSYHGHKGVIALTGYNGILGYRTDISYKTRENLDDFQKAWFEEHPDFDEAAYEKECEEAAKVANAMKENGWEFASHTWGHINVSTCSMEHLQTDTEKWMNYVSPLIGGTDMIIFAFGADLGDWTGYKTDNEKFNYLKNIGFNIYCNVDSTQYWVQFGNNVENGGQYMRQGRRNLDGYRMYYNPEMVEDLFDANAVFDPARPTPVPPM